MLPESGGALLCALLLSVAFVGALYALVPQKIRHLPREHPHHIWARVAVVTAYVPVATVFVALAATALQDAGSNREESYFVRATEHFQTLITPSHSPRGYATAIAYGVGAIGTLYLGHFFTCIRMESWNSMVQISLDDIRSFRIAEVRDILVGPTVEELVFRYLMDYLLWAGNWTLYSRVLIGPWLFSIAHLHHYFERRKSHSNAHITTLIQCIYTGLFGMIAWVIMANSGSVVANIAAHIFCNMLGLPVIRSSDGKFKPILLFVYLLGIALFVLFVLYC